MSEDLAKLVCPHCAASTTASTSGHPGTCPQCGRGLVAAETDAAEGMLIADLREAFGFDGDASESIRPDRPGAGPNSSNAFGTALGAAFLPPGSRLGDFEILGELGRGGMGIVYRARQVSLSREVALKVLPGYSRYGRSAVRRFRAEAQAAARLHHTNVVSIYAQGEHDGHFYYAMELIDGVGLDVVISSRPDLLSGTRHRPADDASTGHGLPDHPEQPNAARTTVEHADTAVPPELTRADYRHLAGLVAEVADALECAHRRNVIHRDVKPHNILLGTNDRLHLTDFGLARLADSPHLTVSGEVMGTPAYLSPEQVRGDLGDIDHRTDVYSLGVTLYELITRRKPFAGQTREQTLTSICRDEPLSPRRIDTHIPIDLETICLRAMEKEPARRHPTAAILADDLRRFADGRPILSRRTSRLEKAAKWVRRHQALTAALVATALVFMLAGGLTWSVTAARHNEANRLLQDAYGQLAYFSYHNPERVADSLARAEQLGADTAQLHLARALASVDTADWADAFEHLDVALAIDPENPSAAYMLAWVEREWHDPETARAAFERAEQRGPPRSADAWFFRGLVLHVNDPQAAIESYRQANALRAREGKFYPQAMLHLARARNQRLYATRSLDGFDETEAALRQLVDQGHYGGYPHYLLSIAHRLAAEIYRGSSGTRGDALVEEHFAEALEWARLGQEADPLKDRPIAAEAECLESMGLYAEAIEARTRAIEIAAKRYAKCESYHYRWRLHYWLGELDDALADLAVHAECMPESRFYAHVYPALLHAEMGQMESALEHARALADETPDSPMAVLWSATCLRLLGEPEEAQTLLNAAADAVDFAAGLEPQQSEQWMRTLYAFCQGDEEFAALETLAREADAPWKLWGEAYFHAAALQLAAGDREAAEESFAQAYRSFDGELRYTYHARLILTKMQTAPAWPAWMALSLNERLDGLTSADGQRSTSDARSGEEAD